MKNYSPDEYRDMFIQCGFNVPNGDSGIVRCTNLGAHKHGDRHPSMSVTISKGIFNCYACSYSGSIAKVYRETFNKSYEPETYVNGNDLIKLLYKKPKVVTEDTPKGFTAVWENYKSPKADNWLQYRGISDAVANKAGVRYGGVRITYIDDEGEKKTYSVMDRYNFPIYGEDRTLKSIEMRYPLTGIESESFRKTIKKCLYPKRSSVNFLYESYELDTNKKLYVLEGLMDCLAFRSLTGISQNVTSIFGAAITKHQMQELNKFKQICYVYNNDEAGLASVKFLKSNYKGELTLLKPLGNYDDVGEMAIAKVGKGDIEKWLTTETK